MKAGPGSPLRGAVLGIALEEVRVVVEPRRLVVADEVGDRVARGEVADEGGVGLDLRFGERKFGAVADVLDADREVVEADAVAGEAGVGEDLDDGAVAIDEVVGGDVEGASAGDGLAASFDAIAGEVAPGGVEGAAAVWWRTMIVGAMSRPAALSPSWRAR
jgi:hypothetical protein